MRRTIGSALILSIAAGAAVAGGGPSPTLYTWDSDNDTLNGVTSVFAPTFSPIGGPVSDVSTGNELELFIDGLIYVNDGSNARDDMHVINPADGSFVSTIALNYTGDFFEISGMECIHGVMYVSVIDSTDYTSSLATLDLDTGDFTIIGPTGTSSLTGLAWDGETLYGVNAGRNTDFTPVTQSNLHTINLNTGAATTLGPIDFDGSDIAITAMEFGADGILYAIPNRNSAAPDNLLVIDPDTLVATNRGDGDPDDIDSHLGLTSAFKPATKGTLYGWDSSFSTGINTLEVIDPAAPSSTAIGLDQSGVVSFPNEIEFAAGVVYAHEGSLGIGNLYEVDPATGTVTSTISLAFPGDFEAIPGLEYINGVMYGAAWDSNESQLCTVDLNTGAVNLIGVTGIFSPITGIAYNGDNPNFAHAVTGGGSNPQLLSINLFSGSASVITDLTLDGAPISITGLEYDVDGTLYALPARNTSIPNHLLRVDPVTGVMTDLGDMGSADNYAITSTHVPTGPAGLYIWDTNFEALWAVDERIPQATQIGASQQSVLDFPAEIEYVNGEIIAIEGNARESAYRVDPATGCVTEEIELSYPPEGSGATALEQIGDRLYASITEGGMSTPSFIATINLGTGVVSTVGATGINGPIGGLAYDGFDTYAVTSGGSNAALYTIDLMTGAATFVADVLNAGNLLSLSGLEFGEDGVLYAISNPFGGGGDGALYSIDPATGDATLIGNTAATRQVGLTSTREGGRARAGLLAWDGGFEALNRVNETLPSAVQIGPDFTPGVSFPNEIEFGYGVVYANEGSNGSDNFYTMDPDTGLVLNTVVLDFPGGPMSAEIPALEQVGVNLYGMLWQFGGTSDLVIVDPVTGDLTIVGDTGVASPFGGLFYTTNGVMFAMTAGGSDATIYTIDLSTGAATFFAQVLLDGQPIGITAAEIGLDGLLYASPNNQSPLRNNLLRIQTLGTATDLGDTGTNLIGLTSTLIGCSPADLSPTFGTLDFNDVIVFLTLFGAGSPVADFQPTGALDFNDVIAFLTLFSQGCP